MKTRFVSVLLLACLTGLTGCGSMDSGPSGRSDSQIKGKPIPPEVQAQANLVAEVDGLKSQVQRQSVETEELNSQIRALTEGDGSGGSTSLAELSRRIAKLEANQRQMASQLGLEVDGQQAAAQQGAPAPGQAPAAPQGAPAGQAPAAQAPAPQAQQAPAKPAPAPAAPQADAAEAIYGKAMQAYQAKNYDQAATLWGDLAKAYPKHSLASNAYFWRGECYFAKNDMPQAVLNYQEVIEKFPKSNKAPSAMLKQGMAFSKLGKKDAARIVYHDLIKKYPDSAEAKRAKTFL
ncbi:hypothetical protein JCM15519_05180 [Fundidesulfovibrio butyratiphilus]